MNCPTEEAAPILVAPRTHSEHSDAGFLALVDSIEASGFEVAIEEHTIVRGHTGVQPAAWLEIVVDIAVVGAATVSIVESAVRAWVKTKKGSVGQENPRARILDKNGEVLSEFESD